jgi:hypothetical protein
MVPSFCYGKRLCFRQDPTWNDDARVYGTKARRKAVVFSSERLHRRQYLPNPCDVPGGHAANFFDKREIVARPTL